MVRRQPEHRYRRNRNTLHNTTAALLRPCALAVVAGLAILCAAREPVRGQPLGRRSNLSGDWDGWRNRASEHGLDLEAAYIVDVVSNVGGGQRRRTFYLDNIDLTLTCRTQELTGFDAGTFFFYGLSNHGGNPSSAVGDLQGTDNVQAPDQIKLYEAWWQKGFWQERFSLLAGLYDLNSEFDVLSSAALLLNGSFGVGPELATSGRNGASVFPNTALAARFKAAPVSWGSLQAAVLDGVPGDPDAPGTTAVDLSQRDGVMVAVEASVFVAGQEEIGPIRPLDNAQMMRLRRRRVGRGWGALPYVFKASLGTWFYTSSLPRVAADGAAPHGSEHGHPGAYLDLEYDASQRFALARGIAVFARAGIADGEVQRVDGYAGGGLAYTGPLAGRMNDRAAFGVAAAHLGNRYRDAESAVGRTDLAPFEIALEWTYRAAITPWLSLQPDVQWVIDPSGRRSAANAVVLALRTEVVF
jgi:porin